MAFTIRMGIPEMKSFWDDLTHKADNNELKGSEKILFKKLTKALGLLKENPKHRGLASHPIDELSKRYKHKVWQSYLENNTPQARYYYRWNRTTS